MLVCRWRRCVLCVLLSSACQAGASKRAARERALRCSLQPIPPRAASLRPTPACADAPRPVRAQQARHQASVRGAGLRGPAAVPARGQPKKRHRHGAVHAVPQGAPPCWYAATPLLHQQVLPVLQLMRAQPPTLLLSSSPGPTPSSFLSCASHAFGSNQHVCKHNVHRIGFLFSMAGHDPRTPSRACLRSGFWLLIARSHAHLQFLT